jgi:hypothetical protein
MKEGYKVNSPVGNGWFIEVYNFIGLNQIGHYRFSIPVKKNEDSLVGIWKPKTI